MTQDTPTTRTGWLAISETEEGAFPLGLWCDLGSAIDAAADEIKARAHEDDEPNETTTPAYWAAEDALTTQAEENPDGPWTFALAGEDDSTEAEVTIHQIDIPA